MVPLARVIISEADIKPEANIMAKSTGGDAWKEGGGGGGGGQKDERARAC